MGAIVAVVGVAVGFFVMKKRMASRESSQRARKSVDLMEGDIQMNPLNNDKRYRESAGMETDDEAARAERFSLEDVSSDIHEDQPVTAITGAAGTTLVESEQVLNSWQELVDPDSGECYF